MLPAGCDLPDTFGKDFPAIPTTVEHSDMMAQPVTQAVAQYWAAMAQIGAGAAFIWLICECRERG